MDLTGKTALVTGGAVRLGRAICLALAGEGAQVVVHYRNSRDAAQSLVGEIRSAGGSAWAVAADLVSEQACAGLIAEASEASGGLDILVNNAAVFNRDRLPDVSEARLLGEFWPNLFAPVLLTRHVAAAAPGGHIVHLLDRRITGHDTSCVPYQLAKKALAEFTALAALELAPRFAVNAVAPGVLLPPPGEGASYLEQFGGAIPLDYACTEQDISDAVLYLLKSRAHTGQILFVDGGKHLLGETHE
jgi:NAD(P)-dependent dehydrogenase (short-subunit alcohol dehydrogenase family)